MKYSKQDKTLISSFVQAQKELEHFYLQAIREKNLKKAKRYAKRAEMVVEQLQEEYQEWSLTRGAQEYLKGFEAVDQIRRGKAPSLKLGTDQIFLQVGKLHTQAVMALVNDGNRAVVATLDGVKKDITYSIGLFNQKNKGIGIQGAIQSKIASGLLTGKTITQQKSDLLSFFQKRGLQFRDRSGRKWDPATYAEMLVRTETARAYNAGTINRALELGTSKFRIEESWDCCSICQNYSGKVVDLSKGGAYDLPPYHPNCRGTVIPIFEENEDWKDNHFPDSEVAKQFEWEIGKVNQKYLGAESPIGTINEIVVRKYTNNDGFSTLNSNLRDNKPLDKKDSFISKTLDKVINNNLDYKKMVYRGIGVDKKTLNNIIASLEWKEQGFVSTSKDEKVAKLFASHGKNEKVILKIHHKGGMDIEKYSNYAIEKEVLLGKNKTFKITGIQKKSDFTYLTIVENE